MKPKINFIKENHKKNPKTKNERNTNDEHKSCLKWKLLFSAFANTFTI